MINNLLYKINLSRPRASIVFLFVLLLIGGLICVGWVRVSDRVPLVRIGRRLIYADTFCRTLSPEEIATLSASDMRARLEDFAQNQLFLYSAYRQGLHKTKYIREQVNAFKTNALIERFLHKMIIDSIITENYLRERYRFLSQEYRLSHPYSKERSRLYQKALTANRHLFASRFDSLMRSTANQNKLVLDRQAIDSLTSIYNDNYIRRVRDNGGDDPIAVLRSFDFAPVLAKAKSTKYDKAWLIKVLESRRIDLPPGRIGLPMMANIVNTVIIEDIFSRQARRMGLLRDRQLKDDLRSYTENLLLNHFKQNEFMGKITLNDDSLKAFYDQHAFSRYASPGRAEVQEIFISDSITAALVLKQLRQGANFSDLAKKHTERNRDKSLAGYIGYLAPDQYGEIGKIAQQLEPGTVHPRLIRSGNGYSIIKVFRKQRPEPKSFSAVKPEVINDYTESRLNFLQDSLEKSLSNRFTFIIYYQNLSKIIK